MLTRNKFSYHAFLLNAPFSLSAEVPNNIWMEEMEISERAINHSKAIKQWFGLYNFIASQALTYLLPSKDGLQDQVYVANVASILPHISDTAIIASFRSTPRIGEEEVGKSFFDSLGYKVYQAPKYFEGEADLKYLKDNIYFGAYGMRTSQEALRWLELEFNMKIIAIKMNDPYLYHLDCLLFPISNNSIMAYTSAIEASTIRDIEKHAKIISVSEEDAYNGVTNCIRLGKTILCSSNIEELSAADELYAEEKAKIAFLEKVCVNEGFEPVFFNLSEFGKSGAMLSCCVLNLNYNDYVDQSIHHS